MQEIDEIYRNFPFFVTFCNMISIYLPRQQHLPAVWSAPAAPRPSRGGAGGGVCSSLFCDRANGQAEAAAA